MRQSLRGLIQDLNNQSKNEFLFNTFIVTTLTSPRSLSSVLQLSIHHLHLNRTPQFWLHSQILLSPDQRSHGCFFDNLKNIWILVRIEGKQSKVINWEICTVVNPQETAVSRAKQVFWREEKKATFIKR